MSEWFSQIEAFLQKSWEFELWTVTVREFILVCAVVFVALLLVRYFTPYVFSYFVKKEVISKRVYTIVKNILNTIIGLFAVIIAVRILGLDGTLFSVPLQTVQVGDNISSNNLDVSISTFLFVGIIFKIAQLTDWAVRILLYRYSRDEEETSQGTTKNRKIKVNRTVRYLVYISAIVFVLNWLNLDLKIMTVEKRNLTVSNLLKAANTLLIAWMIIWVIINFILQSYYKRSNVDVGNQFAINQLVKYVVYIFAILIALQNNLHFDLNILLGGAAALLVGIGLGMQHIFNDLISGIILLFERTVEVGHVVEVDGMIGTVTSIGIRTSSVLILDKTTVVVPNSKFISERVKNWSHHEECHVRFYVSVGIAYGSDTTLAKKLLLEVAEDNPDILKRPAPFVRFTDFGDSALIFELHFWSRNYLRIEDVKSDLRFNIDYAFRKHNIEIPFPQVVVWKGKED